MLEWVPSSSFPWICRSYSLAAHGVSHKYIIYCLNEVGYIWLSAMVYNLDMRLKLWCENDFSFPFGILINSLFVILHPEFSNVNLMVIIITMTTTTTTFFIRANSSSTQGKNIWTLTNITYDNSCNGFWQTGKMVLWQKGSDLSRDRKSKSNGNVWFYRQTRVDVQLVAWSSTCVWCLVLFTGLQRWLFN